MCTLERRGSNEISDSDRESLIMGIVTKVKKREE